MYSEQICSGVVNNSETYIDLWKFTWPVNNMKPNFKNKSTDASNIACLRLKGANYEPNVTSAVTIQEQISNQLSN